MRCTCPRTGRSRAHASKSNGRRPGWLPGDSGRLGGRARGGADDPLTRTIRDGFETPATVWEQEQTDAMINLFAHDRIAAGRARRPAFGALPVRGRSRELVLL